MKEKTHITGEFTIGIYLNTKYHNLCITGIKNTNIRVSKKAALEIANQLGIKISKGVNLYIDEINEE